MPTRLDVLKRLLQPLLAGLDYNLMKQLIQPMRKRLLQPLQTQPMLTRLELLNWLMQPVGLMQPVETADVAIRLLLSPRR